MKLLFRSSLTVGMLLLLAGCASTEKAYDKASESELSGNWEEAANGYIEVLRRDPDFGETKLRLVEVGQKAVDRRLETAFTFEGAGNFKLALDELNAISSLVDRASAVGVRVPVPSDYESRRAFVEQALYDQLVADAESALADGKYDQARSLLGQAADSVTQTAERRDDIILRRRDVDDREFGVLIEGARDAMNKSEFTRARDLLNRADNDIARTPDRERVLRLTRDAVDQAAFGKLMADYDREFKQNRLTAARRLLEDNAKYYEGNRRAELDAKLGSLLVTIAQRELNEGFFRQSYDTASQAQVLLGPGNGEDQMRARGILMSAIAQGVRRVAVVPLWQTEMWDTSAPPNMREDVNDALTFDRIEARNPFLEIVEPREVMRMLRVMQMDDRPLTTYDMRDLARRLEVDFVLAGELTRYLRTDRVLNSRQRNARERGSGGARVNYTWNRVQIDTQVDAVWRVLDASTSTVIMDEVSAANATRQLERGEYAGDWRVLDLNDAERALLDPSEWLKQDLDYQTELADKLADDIMRRIDTELPKTVK